LKRIITIQDISCVGRCSITVALPIISAAGVETAVLPTAVLSTHTAFPKFTFRDLTDEIQPISDTFRELGIGFDAIYTGYLGSPEQIRLVEDFLERFRTRENLVVIDPAMADEGVLYKGFTQQFADRMAVLCSHADLILPNLTEASYMLRIPYREDCGEADLRQMLVRLTQLGAKRAALTGVSLRPGRIGCFLYDSVTGEYDFYDNEKLPVSYHGTGDVFASCAVAGCMRGLSIPQALHLAVDFTLESMKKTMADPERRFYGVNFEQALPMLIGRLPAEA